MPAPGSPIIPLIAGDDRSVRTIQGNTPPSDADPDRCPSSPGLLGRTRQASALPKQRVTAGVPLSRTGLDVKGAGCDTPGMHEHLGVGPRPCVK